MITSNTDPVIIVANEYKNRRQKLVDILGKENYGAFEQMHLLRTNLVSSGKTRIVIAPDNMQVLTGLDNLPLPTAKLLPKDDLIRTTQIDEHGVTDRQSTGR